MCRRERVHGLQLLALECHVEVTVGVFCSKAGELVADYSLLGRQRRALREIDLEISRSRDVLALPFLPAKGQTRQLRACHLTLKSMIRLVRGNLQE